MTWKPSIQEAIKICNLTDEIIIDRKIQKGYLSTVLVITRIISSLQTGISNLEFTLLILQNIIYIKNDNCWYKHLSAHLAVRIYIYIYN